MVGDGTFRGLFRSDRADSYLQAEPDGRIEQLSERVHRVTVGNASTIVVEGSSALLIVDSFGTPGRARVFRRILEEKFPGKPIDTIVYSHDHVDATGFSKLLAGSARIVADEMTADVVEQRDLDSQLLPDRQLEKKRVEVRVDDVSARLVNPGPTHGTGNRAVYIPSARLLFMADTIMPDARYGLFPDYHLGNFVSNMRDLLDLEFEHFVPSRGGEMNRDDFNRACNYVESLMTAAQRAFAEGLPIWERETIGEFARESLGSEFGDLGGFENHVGLSALRAAHHFLMGGWGLEDTPRGGLNRS